MNEAKRAHVAEVFPLICAGIAAGELVKDLMVTHQVKREEVTAHFLTVPGARAMWDAAKEASADAFIDEAMEVARDPHAELQNVDGKPVVIRMDAQVSRLRVDTLKWAARIRNPRVYGDKAQLDVNVRTVDLTAIIRDANARLAAAQQGRVIDVTPSKPGEAQPLAHAQLDPAISSVLPAELAALL